MPVIVYNPNATTDIELLNLGITIPALGTYDVSFKDIDVVRNDPELADYIAGSTLQVARTVTPNVAVYPATVGLQIISTGVIPSALGIGYNNLTANRAPLTTDDVAAGYSQGSLWVFNQQVWSCNNPTANAAQWYELTQPTALPGIVTGRYYSTAVDSTVTTTSTTSNTLYAIPMQYPAGTLWNRIGVEVTTQQTGNARLGIYANNNGLPSTLLLDAGTVSTSPTGLKEITISYTTTNEWFWLVCVLSATTTLRTINAADGSPIFGRTLPSEAATRRVQATFTYGVLPANFPTAVSSTANPPLLWVRRV